MWWSLFALSTLLALEPRVCPHGPILPPMI
jgi:hypothetical protein